MMKDYLICYKNEKNFIDTNIIIDILMQRNGYLNSARVLALSKKEDTLLFVSVLTMANIAYILRKS